MKTETNAELKEHIMTKNTWKISEFLELIKEERGEASQNSVEQAYEAWSGTSESDLFYASNVLISFIDDLDEPEVSKKEIPDFYMGLEGV
ncbi:MAG: hypothetical protein HOG49_08265 [Candidatus Scalindua sp.]|jgi:hypothetical protein|nr:hypothetical protein [Candidatus Scalindua sp.]